MTDELRYLYGFGAVHQSEALDGALPEDQNSPRRAPYGLFPEQVNGAPFTVPRRDNARTWLYRIRPSVERGDLAPAPAGPFGTGYLESPPWPDVIGWRPRALPAAGRTDFADSLETLAGAGDPARGEPALTVQTFACGADMADAALLDQDGDLLLVPDTGALRLRTELGLLEVRPGEVAVVPRALPFQVTLSERPARGLAVEICGRHFRLPERGPIGANGLADERHFAVPTAAYEDREVPGGFSLIVKMGGRLYRATRSHSPFDVVAWHGTYVPYKYDLFRFNAVGTITFDHPDPSIFTVLSAPLGAPGENLADLVVFPQPRWEVAEHTFRPPFYHRNAASELNAIVTGPTSDRRVMSRGGLFLTPPYAPHGVSPEVVDRELEKSDEEADRPRRAADGALWIQLESCLPLRLAPGAESEDTRDPDFRRFAVGVTPRFDPARR